MLTELLRAIIWRGPSMSQCINVTYDDTQTDYTMLRKIHTRTQWNGIFNGVSMVNARFTLKHNQLRNFLQIGKFWISPTCEQPLNSVPSTPLQGSTALINLHPPPTNFWHLETDLQLTCGLGVTILSFHKWRWLRWDRQKAILKMDLWLICNHIYGFVVASSI